MQHVVSLRFTLLWLLTIVLPLIQPTVSTRAAVLSTAPALVLNISADQPSVATGGDITYTVRIANVGGSTATNLALTGTIASALSYITGSTRLAGNSIADPVRGIWNLPSLDANTSHTLTFRTRTGSVVDGQALPTTVRITGTNASGQPISANNTGRNDDDTDTDDQATALVYGPLTWVEDAQIVAYEDLKNFNWSDWDYNDFVVRMVIRRGSQPNGRLAAIEVRYNALARGAGFLNHKFFHGLPFNGGGWYRVSEWNTTGELVRTAQQGFEEEPDVLVYDSTRRALPQPTVGDQTNTRRDQEGVVPGFTATLTAVLNTPTPSNARDVRLPWDPYLYVVETQQAIHIVQPGKLDNTQVVTNRYDSTSPLIGYDLPLAQVLPETWRWPSEFVGIWRGYPLFSDFIRKGGAKATDWHTNGMVNDAIWNGTIPGRMFLPNTVGETKPTSRYFAAPVAADLTGDGKAEIILGNLLANQVEIYTGQRQMLAGWPQAVGGGIRAAAAVADISGDGKSDVLVGAADGKLYAWHANGTPVAGWPVKLGVDTETYRILATPAIGDVDGDGQPEIVVPLADGRLYMLEHDGSLKSGWPIDLGLVKDQYGSQIANSSPRLADIDGNGSLEIVVGSTDGKLYVFDGTGTLRWNYTTGDMILGAPVVAEFDSARTGLEIGVASGDGYVSLLAADGHLIWRNPTDWTIRSTPIATDLDGDEQPELLVGGDDNQLWAWHADGSQVAGWPQMTGGDLFGSPSIGDITGDGQPDVVIGSDDGNLYAWNADGTLIAQWPQSLGASVKGAPALANIDANPDLEIAAADMNGTYTVFGATYTVGLPMVGAP